MSRCGCLGWERWGEAWEGSGKGSREGSEGSEGLGRVLRGLRGLGRGLRGLGRSLRGLRVWGGSGEGSEGSVSRCACLGMERRGEAGRPRSAGNPGLLFRGLLCAQSPSGSPRPGQFLLGARPHGPAGGCRCPGVSSERGRVQESRHTCSPRARSSAFRRPGSQGGRVVICRW